MKLCILCVHAFVGLGGDDYYQSYSGEAYCSRERWSLDADEPDMNQRADLLSCLRTAETCPDYEQVTEESLEVRS